MNKIKKPISLLLVLVMCLSFLPTAALADVVAEAAHTHNEGGWTCVEQPKLICEVEEHTHDDSCWQAGEQTLTCGQEESGDHHHSEECYTPGERTLVCELEEHTHTDACYKTEWTCTAPVETEGTAEETEGETKEPAEETEGTEAEIPEGADVLSAKSLWKYARAYNGKAMNMPQFFGLVQTDSQQKWPASLTFVGEDVDEEVLLEDAITCGAEVAVTEDAITFDGTEVTVYYYSEDMTAKKPSWFRDDGMYSITPEEEAVVITLKFMDGETVVSEQKLKAGETVQIPAMPAKDHQVFTEWTGLDQWVQDGKLVVPTDVTASTDVAVTAGYTDVWYVTFDDGSRVVDVANVVKGEKLTSDQVNAANGKLQLEAGKSLMGWSETKGSSEPIADLTAMEITGDVTLYPVTVDGVWVNFDSQKGSYVEPRQVENGQVTKPDDPTRAGYTFDGWFTAAEGGIEVTFPYVVTESTTLYAHWTGIQVNYTVIYWTENADWGNTYLDEADRDKIQYSFLKSEVKTGTAGTEPVVSAGNAPQGFKPGTSDTKVIAGDGSTIVNVYFDRQEYLVKFHNKTCNHLHLISSPSESCFTEDTSKTIKAKYGANIASKWPKGTDWTVDPSGGARQASLKQMPLDGKKFYNGKEANGASANYYVEALDQAKKGNITVGGVQYTLDHTDKTSFDGPSITDEDKYDIPGFTFQKVVNAKGNETTSYNGARFLYSRNSYDIVFVDGTNQYVVSKKYQEPIGGGYTISGAEAGSYSWCLDQTLTKDATEALSGNTPIGGLTVYAKWKTDDKNVKVVASIKEGATSHEYPRLPE